MTDVHVLGMHGMGDCIHARAIIRQLLERHDRVWLETPWPCLYHDLVSDGRLIIINKASALRTQKKNAQREANAYSKKLPARTVPKLRIWYPPDLVRKQGSVLGAMLHATSVDKEQYDFMLPVPDRWQRRAEVLLRSLRRNDDHRPLLIIRPLVDRTEWKGCTARNPDHLAYRDLLTVFQHRFFTISIADLVPNVEWLTAGALPADAIFHRGELDIEIIAGLVQQAALTYASPGFMVPLSQAVGTPSICVFGGYENGSSFSLGAKLTPHLPVEPITPCQCFSHTHRCNKKIDVAAAARRIVTFIEDHVNVNPADSRQAIHWYEADQLVGPDQALHESGRTGVPDCVVAADVATVGGGVRGERGTHGEGGDGQRADSPPLCGN